MQPTAKTKAAILSVAALLAVAVILLVLALTVWSPPGKQDFVAARKLTGESHKSYHAMVEAFDRHLKSFEPLYDKGMTAAEVADATASSQKAFEQAYRKHMDDVGQLADHKALRDDALRGKFKPYQAHDSKFSSYLKHYLASWPLYLRVTKATCADVFTAETIESHEAAAPDCLKDLNALSQSKNAPLATYAKAFRDYVNGRGSVMKKIANDEISGSEARRQIETSLPDQFEEAANAFAESYQKDFVELASEKQFEAFNKLITRKAKQEK